MARKLQRKRWRRPQRLTLEGPPVARRKDLVMPTVMDLEPGEAAGRNRRRTAVLLVVFGISVLVEAGAVAAALMLAGLPAVGALLAVLIAVSGAAYLAAGARYGDGWARYALRATPVTAPEILNAVDGVCSAAKAPSPELLMVPGELPNSLSLGLRTRWVAVTSGTTRLSRLEREALVAHELAHLRDADSSLASLFVLTAGAIELASKALGAPRGWLALLSVPVWPACLVVRACGRLVSPADREHRADVVGSLVTRYPPAMASLLRRAGGEHAPAALRVTDRFWFAPRTRVGGPDVHERATLVAEM
ncbi:MAG TPA: hypothetical protein VM840_01815 [Actinomycetota bacterium]|nr:hypothetical protein [Actinomycetota bacterium]